MRPLTYKLLPCLLLFYLAFSVKGQSEIDNTLDKLELNQALYPPEDILSTKSIVLLSVPEVSKRSEWMILVDELQQFLAEQGIDAVAYIENESLFSIPNKQLEIPEVLKKREIKNLILFTVKDKESSVFLAIGPYNGQASFFDKGASFWARQSSTLSPVTSELDTYFKTGALYRDNLLVNESAEFFLPEVNLGIVSKSIPPKLADFKVAIQAIDPSLFQQRGPAVLRYDNFYDQNSFQMTNTERNYQIEALAVDSTNNIFSREKKSTNQDLRKNGFQYELMYVSGPETKVYDWIAFPDRQPALDRVVHKFYLSDLRNNNIYVGKKWDASTDWSLALEHFLEQMNEVIRKNSN